MRKDEIAMEKKYSPLELTRFIVGRGSLDFLGQLSAKRAAVIHGGANVMSTITKNRIQNLIEKNGGKCQFISEIINEPYFSDIKTVGDEMKEFQPDLIIALGGGSVIDTAKAIHLFYEYPNMSLEDSLKPYQLPTLGDKAKMVAIPTTSGTGSETTSAAVFTDDESKQKHLMLGNGLIPAYSIIDADFTDSLPSVIAAHTGMDALTHAMEAAVSMTASPMVVSIAIGAALDLLENLKHSVNENITTEGKRKVREICHIAASMSGVAITNSCAGLAHGFDQPGPYFGIPHGQICGLLLPYTTAFTGVHPSYITIAKRIGIVGNNDGELCQSLVDYIVEFNRSIGIPESFSALGIDEKEFMDRIDIFSELAVSAIATKLSPRIPNINEAKELFIDAFYGKKPLIYEE
ncbi:iron-containing alcohol dehydrogenase [Alkaliphilus peptidifermentans]|uniref:Alcohol dehydrogenase, class IV n=1 Tax=Alkaliphilus peptidifermentans DSM 18978 TaxID=1120976 RepID=A0A1G5CU02_9FIRM|nr:iron-containing alcohol dehydrogenase [Alkaliphilus peptidifermentans]SCY05935.1 Alcohol dehydrogenase, class IV [Alkaliphilus peptidifermentans DSM 18978]